MNLNDLSDDTLFVLYACFPDKEPDTFCEFKSPGRITPRAAAGLAEAVDKGWLAVARDHPALGVAYRLLGPLSAVPAIMRERGTVRPFDMVDGPHPEDVIILSDGSRIIPPPGRDVGAHAHSIGLAWEAKRQRDELAFKLVAARAALDLACEMIDVDAGKLPRDHDFWRARAMVERVLSPERNDAREVLRRWDAATTE